MLRQERDKSKEELTEIEQKKILLKEVMKDKELMKDLLRKIKEEEKNS